VSLCCIVFVLKILVGTFLTYTIISNKMVWPHHAKCFVKPLSHQIAMPQRLYSVQKTCRRELRLKHQILIHIKSVYTASSQRPYRIHTTFSKRLHIAHDVSTARLQRFNGALTERTQRIYSVRTAIISFKIFYYFFIFQQPNFANIVIYFDIYVNNVSTNRLNDVWCPTKLRDFTLRHKVRHLGQSEDWIVWVSLVTRPCNHMFDVNSFPAILSGIGRHFKFCRYVNSS